MIQYIKINGKEYPLIFSFRAVFSFMDSNDLNSIKEADEKVSVEFDALLSLYEQAFKKGARKDKSFDDKPLSAEEIEDALDNDPELFLELQKLFGDSKVVQSFANIGDTEKK